MAVTQEEFTQALLSPERRPPAGLSDPEGRAAGKRFDVYRNNVAVSLTEALETGFPVLVKLLGEQNFRVLAGAYLRQHPPASPLMMFYGAEMPEMLGAFPPTADTRYLPDVARLELALRAAYHAKDAHPFEPERLQALPPQRLMAARLVPAPAVRLIRSRWPVFAIWRYNTEDGAPKPAMAAEDVLVVRPGFDPWPECLPAGGGGFMERVLSGGTFAEALDAALAETPEFDLTGMLALMIRTGSIMDIEE